jgi:hypothetical protein
MLLMLLHVQEQKNLGFFLVTEFIIACLRKIAYILIKIKYLIHVIP